MMRVLHPGLATSVQDAGRVGFRHLGVARAGAMDTDSAALANWLVGNPRDTAVLECTLIGPTLRFDTPVVIAMIGADAPMHWQNEDGTRHTVRSHRPVQLPAGTLRIGAITHGARSWLAIRGGLDVPMIMGSRSTDLRGGFGGHMGRLLQKDDVLGIAPSHQHTQQPCFPSWWIEGESADLHLPIRYVPLADAPLLHETLWQVDARSNRQGIRLQGEAIAHDTIEQISAPVAPGTIQLPPDGQPIILCADAQTVGGYPRLGHVIAADLPRLAQCRGGETLHFEAVTAETASVLWRAKQARRSRLEWAIARRLQDASA